MNIYLIRHTKVNINPQEICYGQADIELQKNYIDDFKKIKNKLSNIKNKTIITSPLKRCQQLANYLGKYQIDNNIMELNFGDWELKEWKHINKKDLEYWTDGFINRKCPHGESYNDLINRTKNFYNTIIQKQYQNIIIITHKAVIISIITIILGIPLENSFKLQIDYSSISKIIYENNNSFIEYINRMMSL